MKKILLLDTAFASLPIYEYLTTEGFDVWVMGNRAGDALALYAPDRWINQNYSNVEEVKEHILNLGIDFVVPGCTDMSIETCLRLNVNSYVFDDVKTYNKLGNKNEFRKICSELGLPSPRVVEFDEFPLEGRYICKPVDAFSGRGVSVVDGMNMQEVTEAYRNAIHESTSANAIIETYATGQLYSFSCFIEDQKVKEFFIVKEGSSVNPYAVDTSYYEEEALEQNVVRLLKESIEKLSDTLKLKDGLLHLQFILDNGKPYMIEMSRRCPGDLYSLLIEYSTGFEYASKYASYFISEQKKTSKKYRKYIVRHTVASKVPGNFLSLRFIEPIRTYSYFPLLGLGHKVEPNQKTRIGIVFTEANDEKSLVEDYEKLMSHQVYQFETLY